MIKIVIGTRGSELARAQARMVEEALREKWPDLTIETKIIRTRGDESRSQVRNLCRGRKGLFTAGGLAALEENATIATGSVRRKYQLSWKRPDVKIVDLRGNVPTRLRKLAENDWHAIILARAGLERLGLSPAQNEIMFEGQQFFTQVLPQESFLPAGGQGIIAIQIRADHEGVREIVDSVNDHETLLCLRAEREFLRLLQGDCNSPVGVLATIENGTMQLRAQLFDQLTVAPREDKVEGGRDNGEHLAAQLLKQINGEQEQG